MVKYFTLSKIPICLTVYLQKDKDTCDNCKHGEYHTKKNCWGDGKGPGTAQVKHNKMVLLSTFM